VRVLFVCLGNICRSPTAEAVFKDLVEREGLADRIEIDSAGTGDWHVGEEADPRTRHAAKRRGIKVDSRARQVKPEDFRRFDYVVAMDASNERNLRALAPDQALAAKVHLFRDFDPESPSGSDVPDPYYGGDDGFERVLDICDAAAHGLLERIRRELDPK
jgi:protein-tyrosine phosphatase